MSQVKLNFAALVGAMKAAGKSVLENVWQPVQSFGTINTMSPSFLGRRQYASGGEYIVIRDGQNCVAISLATGTPKGSTAFEIKQLEATADGEIKNKEGEVISSYKKGDKSFKAYAIVEEEE